MKSLALHFCSPPTVNEPIRIRVIYDKNTNAAAPAATDVLEADTILALNQNSTAGRFITLLDEILTVDNSNSFMMFKRFIKLDLPVTYSGTAATVASISAGGLFVMLNINGQSYASQPTISYARIRFTDA